MRNTLDALGGAVDPVQELFANLDKWRHLPSYQLERRADVFFSLYLAEALEAELGFRISPTLIPEFPVCRSGDNRTFKVDYLAVSADGSTLIFVELKTDRGSRRGAQDEYLAAASRTPASELFENLSPVVHASKSRGKYGHLIERLKDLRLVKFSGKKAWEFVSEVGPMEARVVYVQPRPIAHEADTVEFDCPVHIICLSQFADVVRRYDDPLSQRFADSLVEWERTAAGNSEGI